MQNDNSRDGGPPSLAAPRPEGGFLAVCWDMDGTLADSEPLHRRTLVAALLAIGAQPSEAFLDETVGLANSDTYALCVERFALAPLAIAFEEWAAFRNAAYALESRALKPRPGAVDVLRAMKSRCPQAIVSNSCRSVLEQSMRGLGLQGLALRSVSRDEVTHPKPDPEPYALAASLMGVAPRCVLVVEDSPVGAAAGLAAGMCVVAWPAPGLRDEAFPAGCHFVRSHEELRAFMNTLIGEPAWLT